MTRGELLLDRVLARQQPVHRRVQIVLTRVRHREVLGQRRRVPPAGGGQLGVRGDDARGYHRQHPIAFAARLGGDQRSQSHALHCRGQGLA